jgi:hypothetical protein
MKALAVLASALGLCAWGCADLPSTLHASEREPQASGHPDAREKPYLPADKTHGALPRAEIYQRATNEFTEACFFKPAEPKTNDLISSLAPLILQEVKDGREPLSQLDRFGTLGLSNGAPVLDCSHPAIYWQADSVQLNGRMHIRLSYLWCYAVAPAGQHAGPVGLPLQGIRVTLNSTGQPVIWEVLADSSGAELIYVSQNLEAAAAAEFGKPLPGRRYSIERSVEEAPTVLVARIIDDGPVAMGPIVYLTAGTRTVSTLICRCMPAQAKKLLGTSVYDLLPFQASAAQSLLPQTKALADAQTAFWPGDPPSSAQLEKHLRLPSAF